MSKIITPEKVRALALKIWTTGNNVTLFQEVITEWLEQNAPEQYSVDWEAVTGNADFVVHKMEMYDTDGNLAQCVNLKTQYRPKSTQQVEVGQVWKDESTTVKVGCLGRVSKNGDESIAFVDIDTNELKTWMLKTFIAKFERL